VLDEMVAQPKYWQSYYQGDEPRCACCAAIPSATAAATTGASRCWYRRCRPCSPTWSSTRRRWCCSASTCRSSTAPCAKAPGQHPHRPVQHRIGLCLGEYARACSANQAGTRTHHAGSAAAVAANG
jgi:D-tagatose-1,6-bisphosphate aldolase subunit GatZ/KbaZ